MAHDAMCCYAECLLCCVNYDECYNDGCQDAESCYDEFCFADSHYVESHYAEYRNAECQYAEYQDADTNTQLF
jgi:hypothetical protein